MISFRNKFFGYLMKLIQIEQFFSDGSGPMEIEKWKNSEILFLILN